MKRFGSSREFSRHSILMILMLTIIIPSFYAQVTTGDMYGIVKDESGNPLTGAAVSITGPSLQGSMGAVSGENGYFRINAIPAGQYQVEISHLSFQNITFENVNVLLGRATSLGEVIMNEQTIEMEELVIKWENPALDPTSTTLGGYLDSYQLHSLPIERDYKSVLTLLPHSNPSYFGDQANMMGASGSDNVYYIDGINVTDSYYAHTGLTMPFNFIKGIEVKQGGYEAEYSKATGGIVNVVTHSGSNKFEANAFSYFTGDVLSGTEKEDSLLPRDVRGFTNYDFGFSVGGPIIKNKFWYYFAYNPIFETQEIKVPGYDIRKDKKTTHAYAAKLNWIALNNTRFMFSVIGNQSVHHKVGYVSSWTGYSVPEIRNIDVVLADIRNGGINMSLDVKKNTRSGVLLSGSIALNNLTNNKEGQTQTGKADPYYEDLADNYLSGGYGYQEHDIHQRMNLKFSGEWEWKKHTTKAGIESEIMRSSIDERTHNLGWIWRIDTNYYEALEYIMNSEGYNIIPGLFIQDSWQLTENFRLNYGLRWDAQFMRGPFKDHKINIPGQIQPRLGIIYHPGRLKIFGHFGRVYTQYPMYAVAGFLFPYDNPMYEYHTDPRIPGTSPTDTIYEFYSAEPYQIIDTARIKGEYIDEFLIGYEMKLPWNLKLGITWTYRELKNALTIGFDNDNNCLVGNPGSGIQDYLPAFNRKYRALEFTLGTIETAKLNFFASYVQSVNKGNYTGFYDQDHSQKANPGNYMGLSAEEQDTNSFGYMPNDQRHVFKFNASYKFKFGLSAGASFWIMSGAPLNEFGTTWCPGRYVFLVERGTAGRMPTNWDLSLRLTYDFKISSVRSRLFLDALHVGNPRGAVRKDQVKYNDSEMQNPNENYGNVIQYQPPMMLRLGISIDI